MRYRRTVANLLAYLEATSLGLVDASEEERSRAQEIAEKLTEAESRKWRAHRRPSPGRSKPMRRAGLVLVLVAGLCALLAATCPFRSPSCGGSRFCAVPLHSSEIRGSESSCFALIESLLLLAPEDVIGGFLRPGSGDYHGTIIGLENVRPVLDVGGGAFEELLPA
jgi:hypothetical protein